jgi:hypothetical protein
MCERIGYRQNEVAVAPNRCNRFSGEHVAIGTGGQLLPQNNFRISPGFKSDWQARLSSKLGEEASCQHYKRGFAEGTRECDQVLVSITGRAEWQVTSLGKDSMIFAAKAQRGAGNVKFEAAVCGFCNEPVNQGGWIL